MDNLNRFCRTFPEDLREFVFEKQESATKKFFDTISIFNSYINESDFLKKYPIKIFQKNDYIIKNYRHDINAEKTLAYLHQGLAKVTIERSVSIKDRKPTVAFWGDKNWLGLESFASFGNQMCYTALTESHVSLVPWEWIFKETPPEVYLAIIAQFSLDHSRSLSMVGRRKTSLDQRVITGLHAIYLSTNSLELEINRTDMADFIGVERQYLSKVLKRLEEKKIIEIKKGSIYLINPEEFYNLYLDEAERQT